ncbi:SCO family protein [Salinimicrobium tongyeongense]|jgi:protein SCO1/2|uniref:SCO family protein n=1 Tax=Salinimicrobium tongyeongense TaxID=2809707 RepID=A0ABY6NMM1_9FLAO|nr:SCO family protein [Salinimicrobium tongyeongense]UZH54124.1 SCO family protein [Salinimicrobium tongyeongense]
MKKVAFILLSIVLFTACNNVKKEEEKVEEVAANTTEVKGELPELSIYNLPSTWTTQNHEDIQLEDLRGNVLVMVMIYTSCKAACPRLIADMRNIEKQVPEEYLDKTKFIMVSIDPETDTPQRLNAFARENEMEDNHWLFLRGTPEDTREFATVLAVSYKKISPIDFSHSNIISVFDEEGVLVHQQEGLGVDNTETVEAIKTEVSN